MDIKHINDLNNIGQDLGLYWEPTEEPIEFMQRVVDQIAINQSAQLAMIETMEQRLSTLEQEAGRD